MQGNLNNLAEAINLEAQDTLIVSADPYEVDSHATLYPATLAPSHFTRKDRAVVVRVKQHAYRVCQTKLPPQYTTWVFNKFQKGIYYSNKNGEPAGFCIWTESHDPIKADSDGQSISRIHILLICAEKGTYKLGSKMLFDVETYCLQNQFNSVELEPVNDKVEEYYGSHGYEIASVKPLRSMVKVIAPVNMKLQMQTVDPVSTSKKTRRRKRG